MRSRSHARTSGKNSRTQRSEEEDCSSVTTSTSLRQRALSRLIKSQSNADLLKSMKKAVLTSHSTLRIESTPDPHGVSSQQSADESRRSRVVHCKKEKFDVYIGRPGPWGNPFIIGQHGDRVGVIERYRQWILTKPLMIERAKKELRGKVLGCWCRPHSCHGDVLVSIVA
jgi:uncharacterized protein DUF4326